MFTSTLIKNGVIPKEYADYIKTTCDCGCEIIRNETLTQAYCSNPQCPYHAKHLAVEVLKYLGAVNIGPATAEKLLKMNGAKYPLDLVPVVFKEKPSVFLWEVVMMGGFRGYDEKLQDICKGYASMTEFLKSPLTPPIFKSRSELLLRAETYFNIKEPLSEKIINVTLTGRIEGYREREDFIKDINNNLGKYIQVRSVGSRINNVDYIVTTDVNSTSSKARLARAHNIPIITPNDFIKILGVRVLNK